MGRLFSVGDTGTLSVRFELVPDPDQGASALERDTASWGSVSLWVHGRNIFEHFDRADGLHNGVRWYLRSPLVWLARLPGVLSEDLVAPYEGEVDRGVEFLDIDRIERGRRGAALEEAESNVDLWWRRHGLCSARRGGVFPEVVFRRVDDEVEVSWSSRFAPSREGVSFVAGEGVALLPRAAVEETLRELERTIRPVLGVGDEELASAGFPSLLSRMRAITDEKLVVSHDGSLGPLGLLAQSIDPSVRDDDLATIANDVATSRGAAPVLALDPGGRPHEQGYEAAERLRAELGLGTDPIADVDQLLARLGVAVRERALESSGARSLATAAPRQELGALVILNTASSVGNDRPAVRRASAMHALGQLVAGRLPDRAVGVAYGTRRGRRDADRRAGAFAAMMLAPRAQLEGLRPTVESIRERTQALGVSVTLLLAHATNLGALTVRERDALTEELGVAWSAG